MYRRYRTGGKPTRVQPSLEEGEYLMAVEIAEYKRRFGTVRHVKSSATMGYAYLPMLDGALALSTKSSRDNKTSIVTTVVGTNDSSLASSKSSTWDAALPTTLWPRGGSPVQSIISRASVWVPTNLLFDSDLDLTSAMEKTSTAVVPKSPLHASPRQPLAVHHPAKTYSLKLPARLALPRLPVTGKAEDQANTEGEGCLAKPAPDPGHLKYRGRKMKDTPLGAQLANVSLTTDVTPPKLQEPLLLRRRGSCARCLTVTIPSPKDKFRAMWAVSETATVA